MSEAVVGVDVGGTTIKALLVERGAVTAERRASTPSPDPTGELVAAAVGEVVRALGGAPAAIGVVVPGVVDEARGVAVRSANVGFHDAALQDLLQRALSRPVAFGHDVRAGALAEARTGAAAGVSGTVVFVPIGTGIAAATLIEGVPVVSGGWAGEIGQLPIAAGEHEGRRMEEVASAAAIARAAGEPDAEAVARRVAAGDPDATAVWTEAVDLLAMSLAGMTATVAPDVIIVGGGLAASGDLLLDPLASALASRLPGLRMPRLVAAHHGDLAAALGAAMMASDLAAEQ